MERLIYSYRTRSSIKIIKHDEEIKMSAAHRGQKFTECHTFEVFLPHCYEVVAMPVATSSSV